MSYFIKGLFVLLRFIGFLVGLWQIITGWPYIHNMVHADVAMAGHTFALGIKVVLGVIGFYLFFKGGDMARAIVKKLNTKPQVD